MDKSELTIIFENADDVLAQEGHLAHGGLYVPLPDPPPVLLSPLQLRMVGPFGNAVDLPVQVFHVAPGAGVALTVEDPDAARRALAPLFAAARRGPGARGAAPRSEWGLLEPTVAGEDRQEIRPVSASERPARNGGEPGGGKPDGGADGQPGRPGRKDDRGKTVYERVRAMTKPERRNLALRGDRSVRIALMKMVDKDIHKFVIQNPRITLDEIQYIAGYRQTHPEVLKRIATNRDWTQNSRVVSKLVCNPKTPSTLAIRLLERLPQGEIARIARASSTPPAIQAAARRKIIDK